MQETYFVIIGYNYFTIWSEFKVGGLFLQSPAATVAATVGREWPFTARKWPTMAFNTLADALHVQR